jgi:hypothetical protein
LDAGIEARITPAKHFSANLQIIGNHQSANRKTANFCICGMDFPRIEA